MLILAFLMFLSGGGLILTGIIGGIAIMFGVTVPFTGLVALAMFLTGGCLEGAALYIFFNNGPSAMMNTMEKALDKSILHDVGPRGQGRHGQF